MDNNYNPFFDPEFLKTLNNSQGDITGKVEEILPSPFIDNEEQQSDKKSDIITVNEIPEQEQTSSPFDRIRHFDEQGEYWLAKELQGLLGYQGWDKFKKVIEKGKQTCINIGEDADYHIRQTAHMVSIGSGAQREVQDYRLTRYACYVIAMNGDSSKPEIAAAQTYFITDYSRLKKEQSSVKQENKPTIAHISNQNNTSPFDRIKHIDDNGNEYWFARELQEVLGYIRWDRFEDSIDRAKTAIRNVGDQLENHIADAGKKVSLGSGAVREVNDYYLTRYGAYMVAMNGDPRKPEIAAAQTYFAVRTRQAELQQQISQPVSKPTTTLEKFAMVLEIEQEHERRILAVEDSTKLISQTVENQSSQLEQIKSDITALQDANKIERPPIIVSKRCRIINGINYSLDEKGILTFSESRDMVYDLIKREFNLDVEQELEKYKTACRRYYEHYKIYKGTPPKDVLRPAAIDKLGWVSWISLNKDIYDITVAALQDYLGDDYPIPDPGI